MTQQHSLNRQGQTIEIGPRHGYRIEGDHAFINAELQIPPQHRSSGEWALELWATEQPYEEGPLTGLKVAQIALELPTPIGPYVYQVDTRTTACLPLQGRPHAMVLALVQQGAEAETSVRAFANYAQPQTFAAPHFEGTVGYRVAGTEVVLQAAGIVNPRPESNLSGTLSLELWAFPVLASGSANDGLRLAAAALEPVAGQAQLSAIERRAAFSEPPVGDYRLALLLCEWTLAHGYVARDRRDFGMTYERPAPAPEVREPSRVPARPAAAAVAAPARPAERLRLVPAVEPETPAPAKAEAAKAEPAKPEPAKPEPAKAEPAKAEPAKPAPAKAELAKAEPAKAEPAKPAPAKAELAKAEPAKAEPAKPTPAKLVSIQSGSVEDLAQVKGLNLKIAKEIVKARPFTSVADLIRVPGIGQKMLDRLKESVSL